MLTLATWEAVHRHHHRRTPISERDARRTIDGLAKFGLIEKLGDSRHRKYRWCLENDFSEPIRPIPVQ